MRRRPVVPALGACALALALPVRAPAQTGTDLFLVRFHEAGGRVVVQDVTRLTDRAGYDNQPHFLPDGGAVLYTAIDGAGQADIHRLDLATLRSTPVTRTAPESEYSATPMPGGARFSAIRVEADSAQRLWSFDMDGGAPRVVIEELRPVGYHAWVDAGRVVVFVLGDPPTLRLADVASGEARTLAEDIGRAIQPVPGRTAVSFVLRDGERPGRIMLLDAQTLTTTAVATALPDNEYHAWTPSGLLLSGSGSALMQWVGGDDGVWVAAGDLASYGVRSISRMAVSPRGDVLVVVGADRGEVR